MKSESLVDCLIERQEAEGWSYREMAREIGVHHMTWYRIAQGQQRPGVKFVGNVMVRFPEYHGQALHFLSSNATASNATDTHSSEAVAAN